jgi:gliding motility-associated-like protein
MFDITVSSSNPSVIDGEINDYDLSSGVYHQNLINNSNELQWVDFTFSPRINHPRSGLSDCQNGLDTTIRIWINPQPKIELAVSPDTVICFNEGLTIHIDSLNNTFIGDWVFDLQVKNISHADSVIGYDSLKTSRKRIFNLQDLENISRELQWIEFEATPTIINPRQGLSSCNNGVSKTIKVYINPQPMLDVSTLPDTLLCFDEGLAFDIDSLNNSFIGDWRYDVIITGVSDPSIIKNSSTAYNKNSGIYDQSSLTNIGVNVGWIEYSFIPKISEPRTGLSKCSNGITVKKRIYINPQPRINFAASTDTLLCHAEGITFDFSTPNANVEGQWVYDVNISGSDLASLQNVNSISDGTVLTYPQDLINTSDALQWVEYEFVPKIKDPRSGQPYCINGITKTIRIYVQPELKVTPDLSDYNGYNIRCHGLTDDVILEAQGGHTVFTGYSQADLDYSWDDGYSGRIRLNIEANRTDFITITDQQGCQDTLTVNLIEPELLTVEAVVTKQMSCDMTSFAEIAANVDGGVEDYSYLWTLRASSEEWYTDTVKNVQKGGDYTVHVTDDNNCYTEDLINVRQPLGQEFQYEIQNLTCHGDSTARVLTTYSTFVYDFEWTTDDGFYSTRGSLDGVPENVYYVKLTEIGLGCEVYDTIHVNYPAPLKIDDLEISDYHGLVNTSCYGENDGYIHLNSVSGGTPGYQYTLYKNDEIAEENTNGIFDNYGAGDYRIQIIDAHECVLDSSIALTELTDFAISDSVRTFDHGYNVVCSDSANSFIKLDVNGSYPGNTGYTYNWDKLADTDSVTNVAPGNYQVQIIDSVGCDTTLHYTITAPDPLEINAIPQDVLCYDEPNGKIFTSPTGGNSQYSYSWSQSGDGEGIIAGLRNQESLYRGQYGLTVTDGNGCQAVETYNLTQPALLTTDEYHEDVDCSGEKLGFIELTANGGISPYEYHWPASLGIPAGINLAEDLVPDVYIVRTIDANGCINTDTIEIEATDSLKINFSPIAQYHGEVISCPGQSDGAITANIEGGKPPYRFAWDTGEKSDTLRGISKGWRYLEVVDKLNCYGIDSTFVNDPEQVIIDYVTNDVSCYGGADGDIEIIPDGGAGDAIEDYQYNWISSPELPKSHFVEGLIMGEYTVEIQDPNNCKATETIMVDQPPLLKISAVNMNAPFCPQMPDGSIEVHAIGGTVAGDYIYSWSNGETGPYIQGLQEDNYTITITDDNGCILEETIFLEAEKDFCLEVPNAITPNNDGYNDKWILTVLRDDGSHVDMSVIYPDAVVEIFNRWGEIVFKSSGYSNGNEWDGTFRNTGEELPVDTYYYVITVEGDKTVVGNVTVIR